MIQIENMVKGILLGILSGFLLGVGAALQYFYSWPLFPLALIVLAVALGAAIIFVGTAGEKV